ncbi:pimeloyl-ACP methyl ester carboxylesterase [Streptomyces tendae]|uniref:alpha/beta fold hydrolase n=1 Tax=Streptomyces tendae TaxID=1932 RepID=UPI003837C3A0
MARTEENDAASETSADTTPRHRMVLASGLRWHVVEAGSGPTIVLVAGFPQNVHAWRHVIPLLARNWHVVAVDLPGQGDSEKPLDGYDTWTAAERLHGLLAELGHERYLLVGHDIGSWVSYPFAHRYPESLTGVVFIDGNIAGLSLPETVPVGPDGWRSWHFLFNAIPDLPEALVAGRERILIEWFFGRKTASWRETFTTEDIAEYERTLAAPGGLRGSLGYYRAVSENAERNKELRKALIQVPMLAIGAELGSAPTLHDDMRSLGVDVSGATVRDCGHYIPEEKPAELVDEIARFAERLPWYVETR